ncbi:EAL domain-containing protein [Novosphingobium taihuense]|uniref:EAL domain-containing protein (Putative c-di-GMP-specific phosphodiesterase class I) n=1 Tax=Novosphingobium taihuense TaxID=260085 RepID=A0A7W7A8U4_9SPHN|nr:EAL domain-containing protein [Novosphingobium taihuense]MBB4612549.1 EAL domain-containing protein (putative c-di-GMP-specific phosphodiesterase class I) [Novosphingobium taihuense]
MKQLRSPLYLALIIPALLALTDLLTPIDQPFRNTLAKLSSHAPSHSTIVLSFDQGIYAGEKSIIGTRRLATVIEQVAKQMPQRVLIDTPVVFGEDRDGDRKLKASIDRLKPDASFVVRSKELGTLGHEFVPSDFDIPEPAQIANIPVVLSAWNTNFMEYGVSSAYSIEVNGRSYPSVAAFLAEKSGGPQNYFGPNTLLDIESIPFVPVEKFLHGEYQNGLMTGRTVIINSAGVVRPVGYFGHGRYHPLALDLAGADALGLPFAVNLGYYPLLFGVWLLIAAASRAVRRRTKFVLYGSSLAFTFCVPAVLQQVGLTADIGAAVPCLAIYSSIRLWQLRVRRVQHTSTSGLPNFLALSEQPLGVGRDVIVAIIARYEEILATLPKELHGECAKQIARRLSVGSGIETIYNGDGGHFAWTEEARPLEMQLNHLEGLRALFSAPLQIGSFTFDTNIHFGLDRNEGLDPQARLNSALASANDALGSGRSVELFEADRLAEATWELSLHARIDEGLRNGEIWLAFQSQWDMRTSELCGAEALIRWNHPTRGPIAPDAFILQAERAGRIDALTYWVVDEAITATLALNSLDRHVQMSINLSAQMVDKPSLVANFAEIVRRRNIDPRLLTVEVTETSSVRNRPAAVQNLSQLRAMGFRLSIDDFGTGEASLAYLADLPSDELKLDRRFVSRLMTRDRERHIIRSTIDLAHALGQTVVAEGIEDEATYRALADMGCDVGQGYFLGKPQAFPEFYKVFLELGRRRFGVV